MSSLKARARWTGVIYLVMSLAGAPALLLIPSYVVAGDAAATAQKVAAGMELYRVLLLGELVGSVLFIVLGWSFYRLFEQVDRGQAMLLLAFVLSSATIGIIDVVLLSPPLIFQNRADWFSGLARPQLDAIGLAFLQIRSFEVHADEMLWGLWLVPLGLLSIKSGFIPKLVGAAVLVAAAGWVTMSVGYIALPAYREMTDRVGNLLAQFELVMILWLLIKGTLSGRPPASQSAGHP